MDYTIYTISINMTGKRWVYWCSINDGPRFRIHSKIAEYRIANGAFVEKF